MDDCATESRSSPIDLADTPDFDVGGLRVRPALRRVEMAGETHALEPKVMQVLVALAAARPGVVARDRLIELCWGGRIVGDDALNRCILALRNLAKRFASPPFAIETVPRVGHRLIAGPAVESATDGTATAVARPRRRRVAAMFALMALVISGVAVLLLWQGKHNAVPAAIAVLPFRNLSSGDPYFAEGVGEEILGQLAREPQFRVIGRTSAAKFRDADLREAGRALGVTYILEGSVRSRGGRVRVSAALVQASDGVRLWSDTYDRELDDIFAIQNAIGTSVAESLKRTIFRTAPLSGPLVTDGETYQLYLEARGLLRTRDARLAQRAVDILRQTIRRDPGYAPAWSSLALALRLHGNIGGPEEVVSATLQAYRAARRALRLAPDLAEAHGVLGMLLSYASPEAQHHVRRAAALDPSSAENMYWLGFAELGSRNFARARQAHMRAIELDPLWFPPIREVAVAHATMGRRKTAEQVAMRSFASDPVAGQMLLARIAWVLGDISEAARRWSIVARTDTTWSEPAKAGLADSKFALGLSDASPGDWNLGHFGMVARTPAPPSAVWRARNRNAVAADTYVYENHVAAKLMLNAGRAAELLATYGGPTGLLGFRADQSQRIDGVKQAPVVALALRRGGRTAEADRLLRDTDEQIRTVYRHGPAPFWFDADAAAVWATQGRTDDALAMLERALARGWTHRFFDDLPRLADEPAFAALVHHPRFKAIEARLDAWREREKRETAALNLTPPR